MIKIALTGKIALTVLSAISLTFLLSNAVPAQRIEDRYRRTIGRISYGRVSDGSYSTIGYIGSSGRIEDGSRRTLGYVDGSTGRVQDNSRRNLGYINSNGRVEDQYRSTLGYVENGRIQNKYRSTIGYYSGVSARDAALFFFFFWKPIN
jgi:hypothetical protein